MSLTIPEVYAKAGTEQIALVQDENIYYIVMNTKYNMIDPAMIAKFNEFLDIIEASKGPAICVTIGAGTKAFSSGFNLMEIARLKHNKVLVPMNFLDVLSRYLTLNVPTLCVVNGHAVAGGLYLAMCHDHIIMSSNPKIKCFLNESLIGIGFYQTYISLLNSLVSNRLARTLHLGDIYHPQSALEADLVQSLYTDYDDLLKQILEFRKLRSGMAKFRHNLKVSKTALFHDIVVVLRSHDHYNYLSRAQML